MVKREDLNIIDIMVPVGLNFKVTEEVASLITGTHKSIIRKKALAATTEEARAARDIPKKYNIPVMITENYNIVRSSSHQGLCPGKKDRGKFLFPAKQSVF